MSEDGGKQEGSISPSNNPHGSPSGSRSSTAPMPPEGQSVVSKLMRIYESMTQSSTPQNPNEDFNVDESHQHQHHQEHHPQEQEQHHHHHMTEHDIPYPYGDPSAFAFMPPDPNYYSGQPSNALSANYHLHHPEQSQMHDNAYAQSSPEVPESNEATNTATNATTTTTTTRSLRKRSLEQKAAAASSDNSINSSVGGRGSKSRKKAKETDNRWSKRFTWPDDLHRDFVSAIFDVGLKHSSPSAIMEHMPKHEQITSERIKSHLQKYRLHRSKSKKEFMTSYEAAFSKFKANKGVLDTKSSSQGKPYAGGEVGAHLSYLIVTEGDNAAGDGSSVGQEEQQQIQQQQQEEQQQQQDEEQQQQQQQQEDADGNATGATEAGSSNDPNAENADTPTNEALMLPQLSESEKRSPIGVSMGYLMGLFFSLKDQLMAQRAAADAAAAAEAAAAAAAASSHLMPVNAVYDSFQGGDPATATAAAAAAGWMNVSDASQQLVSFAAQSAVHMDVGVGAAAAAAAAGVSTRSNLEESTLMKREMQSQMAFQNKMRALKRHELEKYKNSSLAMTFETDHNNNPKASGGTGAGGDVVYKSDDDGGMSGGGMGSGGEMGHPNSQGAGETAMDPSIMGGSGDVNSRQPQRNRGLSVGGSDEFWTSDVVDEQLFEFLMNN